MWPWLRGLLAGAALAVGAPAWGHTLLVESVPADRAQLEAAPAQIVLRFNEPVRLVSLRVVDALGLDHARGERASAKNGTLRLALPELLGPGTYTTSYRVISADAHPVAGKVMFAVGEPLDAAAATAAPAVAAGPVRTATIANRAVHLMSMALSVGGAFYLVLVTPGGRLRRGRGWFSAGGVLALATALLAVGLQGVLIADSGLDALATLEPWRVGLDSTRGVAAGVATAGLIMLFAGLWSCGEAASQVCLWLAVMLGCASFVLSGHAASTEPAWLAIPSWIIHTAVALFWLGSLLPLWWTLRQGSGGRAEVQRFSALAAFAVPMALMAGAAMALMQLGDPAALFQPGYGKLLQAKILLATLLVGLAAYNRIALLPRLAPGAKAAFHLRLTISAELVLGMVILAVAATLSQQVPPRSLGPPAAVEAPSSGEATVPDNSDSRPRRNP
jgi:copper transport protein